MMSVIFLHFLENNGIMVVSVKNNFLKDFRIWMELN